MAQTPEFDPIQLPDVRNVVSAKELSHMLDALGPFDERMVEGTRARLNKDDAKLQRMAKEIERLTDALNKQVNVRRATNAQLQAMSEAAIAQSYADYDSLVADKTRLAEERLDALDERIAALDEHFTMEKTRIEVEIDERHHELMHMLEDFEERFREECELRAEREAAIKCEMDLHEADIDSRFSEETVARDTVIDRIRAELCANIASRQTSDAQFASFVARELATVKARLESETASREKEDDAIEASLSQFTITLQSCMHVVNQTE